MKMFCTKVNGVSQFQMFAGGGRRKVQMFTKGFVGMYELKTP